MLLPQDIFSFLRVFTVLLMAFELVSSCGFPGAPAHSSVTFSTEVMQRGTEAQYSCEAGFELLGPARRICHGNGTWVPNSIPFCVINVAAGKAPMQSSTSQGGIPQKAVDGATAPLFDPMTCSMTQPEVKPLWYVNLLEPYMVQLVRVDFGRSCCSNNRPARLVVRVGNNRPDLETNPICNRYTGYIEEGRPLFLPCNPPMPGAFVSVHLEGPDPQRLSICETFVYTDQALPVERCPQFRDLPAGSGATYNGKCYSFYDRQPRSFAQAQEFCESRTGSLIAETSPALQGFLSWELWRRHKTEPVGQYWLGAVRDPRRPTNWRWLRGDPVVVSFWAPGTQQPGDCAKMDATRDWLWAPSDCGRRLNFVCQHAPLTCGRPEQPPNSTLSALEFSVGSRIVYRCEPGHLMVGPEQRECLPTGFYSAYPPTCKYLQCGLPAEIEGGHYELQNGSRSYLSTVQYQCDTGYTLVGRSALICDVDERWNGPPPRCQPLNCGTPPAILNGAYRSVTNTTTIGALIEYFCVDDRFTLVGAKFIRCGRDANYDQPPPICRAAPTTERPHSNVIEYDRPEQNQVPDTVNIRLNTPPGVTEVKLEDTPEVTAAAPRLNLSGIIALGVFGGFVFLTAVLVTIVIIVRRSRRKPHKHTSRRHYISSSYSTDSETHAAKRAGRRAGAWNGAARAGDRRSPQSRLSSHHGFREAPDVAVTEVAHVYRSGDEKRRHHHHHHHRHHHDREDRPRRH